MFKEEQKNVWPGWQVKAHIGLNSDDIYKIQRENDGTVENATLKVISFSKDSTRIKHLHKDVDSEYGIHAILNIELQRIISDYSVMRKMDECPYTVNCDGLRYEQHRDETGWNVYIKMEQLELLERVIPSAVPEGAIVKMARDLSSALDWGNRIGVIHRNITPKSIYISEAGVCKLGDYRTENTENLDFLAPEAYRSGVYDIRSDIYSLGLVLYWLLNDRRMPFENESDRYTAMERRLSGEILPALERGNDKLKAIVLKACAYDPEERYQLPAEFQQDLSELESETQISYLSEWFSQAAAEDKETVGEITPVSVTDSNHTENQSNTEKFSANDSENVSKGKRDSQRLIAVFSVVIIAVVVIITLLLHSCSDKTESAVYEESTGEESIPTKTVAETTEETTQNTIEEAKDSQTETKGKPGKPNGNGNNSDQNISTGTTEENIPTEPDPEENKTPENSSSQKVTTTPDDEDDFSISFGDLLG